MAVRLPPSSNGNLFFEAQVDDSPVTRNFDFVWDPSIGAAGGLDGRLRVGRASTSGVIRSIMDGWARNELALEQGDSIKACIM